VDGDVHGGVGEVEVEEVRCMMADVRGEGVSTMVRRRDAFRA
jgi:hypothetical protein